MKESASMIKSDPYFIYILDALFNVCAITNLGGLV